MAKSKWEESYLPHDEFVLFNEKDERLVTIKYALPDPPTLSHIDNYGLNPKKQIFKKPIIPSRLVSLEKACENLEEVWEKLNKYKDEYQVEIDFLKREWDRRINGYWVFINGKPVFIDGWHYMYISWWKIDVGIADYRDRDRKFYHFARFCYTTKDAFYQFRVVDDTKSFLRYFSTEKEVMKFMRDVDQTKFRAEKGNFKVDMGRRTVFGFNYPKHRREGATYKAEELNYAIITILSNAHGGIQSMDGTSAKKAFTKAVVKPWKKLPFFYKPNYTGSTDPKTEMNFDIPGVRVGGKGSMSNVEVGLESQITWADSASRQWYDGDKLYFLNNDEIGKTVLEFVDQRWQVQKKCMAQGAGVNIHGFAVNTSTVGEMTEKGGQAFDRLCKLSHYEERNKVGQTSSGLLNFFIPADEGLEGFIDIFGNSVIDDPPEDDIWRLPNPVRDADSKLVGARRYLEELRDDLLLRTDEESIKEYEEEVRLHPLSFSECFITAGSGSGLNLKKITQRMKELMFNKTITVRGNFSWKNGIKDTEVIWTKNEIDGRWVISLELDNTESNLKMVMKVPDVMKPSLFKEVLGPLRYWKFTAGSDPYKFRKTEGRRLSNGGGSVFYEHDKIIDPHDKDLSDWQTNRTVCTYSNRPLDPDDYSEDMLMMCVYFGAMMFPELDIPIVWDHFIRRGYDGYLKYRQEPNGIFKKTPGYSMRAPQAQKIMQLHQDYIENFIELERHIEVLRECKNIKGVEDITNYDLFASVGGSYYGAETNYTKLRGEDDEDTDITDIRDYY